MTTKAQETGLHILRSLPDSTPARFGQAMWPVGGWYNTGRNRKAGAFLRAMVKDGLARRWTTDGRTYLYSAATAHVAPTDHADRRYYEETPVSDWTAPHAFTPDPNDGLGLYCICGRLDGGDMHRAPVRAKVVESDPANRRSFNHRTMEEGMGDAATSVTSEQFRVQFALLMVEVAVEQYEFTTNDVWDLWEARGLLRAGHAQAAGTVGPSGVALGLWSRTDRKVKNLSGNLHSTDDGVRVYQSRIKGTNPADHEALVREHYGALDARAAERAAVKRAEAEAPLIAAKYEAWEECVEAMTAWIEAQSRPGPNGPSDPPQNPYAR